jgi:two-component system, LytTR family, sensor histidine kinase AlgZ
MEPVAVAKWNTVASINQTGTGIRLPNFCNLGVMLRALVVVNLFVLAAAVLRAGPAGDFSAEFLALAAFTEPALIVSLLALCAARRLLHAMAYPAAWVAVLFFELALSWLFYHAVRGLIPGFGAMPFAQVGFLTLFVTGCTLAYFDLRARALAPAIAEARIQALQARIRPHFLYNSINAVLSLMRAEPRRAERALEDMADLFRVLMADNRTLAPIGQEIELAKQYLAIESIRLGDRLRVAWQTEGVPPEALVPPLMLQPLVENAVYHGIEPAEEGGEIRIDIAKVGDRVVLSLANPFPGGGRHPAGNRMAIANIRERLQLHFDAEADMQSEVRDGTYRVTIRVPYLIAAA